MNPGARIVCVREVQKSLKESVKRLIEDKIKALGVSSRFIVQTDRIITPGDGVILFQGMQDHTAESIKSLEGFNIAYVEEAQTLTALSLEMLRPTIREEGSELWFSWNPRSKRDPVDEFLRGPNPPRNSAVVSANYDSNPFFPSVLEDERQDDKIAKPDRYGHIWDGDYEPSALGAYYAKEMSQADREKRITRVPHTPGVPVEVWFDLGAKKQGRTMAVGFVQRVGLELHCIDYETDGGPDKGIPWVAGMLQEKRSSLGYVYGDIVWPHDGAALQKATGDTLDETFRQMMGIQPVIIPISDVAPGIEIVRNTLPSMWFDAEKCDEWVDGLRNYRAEYDDDKRTFKPTPVPDWASHPADMTRYGCSHVPADDEGDWGDEFDDWGRSAVSGY